MICKYQNHPFPPCRFEQHPHNKNVYFCPHCQESYDLRDVDNKPSFWLLLLIGGIIWALLNTHSAPVPTNRDNPENFDTLHQIQ
jgi:hypothetical protein